MKNIAVDKDLTQVSKYLSNRGYNVKKVDTSMEDVSNIVNKSDAAVVTNLSTNIMEMEEVSIYVPTVFADGLSPEEVEYHIEQKL